MPRGQGRGRKDGTSPKSEPSSPISEGSSGGPNFWLAMYGVTSPTCFRDPLERPPDIPNSRHTLGSQGDNVGYETEGPWGLKWLGGLSALASLEHGPRVSMIIGSAGVS